MQMFVNLVETPSIIVRRKRRLLSRLRWPLTGWFRWSVIRGPGIPETEREKVLRRLYRLDKSRSTPGSGLGLSLVRAIADLHYAELALAGNKPGLAVSLSMARASSTAQ